MNNTVSGFTQCYFVTKYLRFFKVLENASQYKKNIFSNLMLYLTYNVSQITIGMDQLLFCTLMIKDKMDMKIH